MNLQEAIKILQRNNFLLEASESDAYNYTKKELHKLPEDLQEELRDNAENPEHWERECYNTLLTRFSLRNTDALYFTPGLARIAYGELYMDGDGEESGKILKLIRYVHFISTAHKEEFNRKLEHKTGVDNKNNPIYRECSYSDLNDMFGTVTSGLMQQEYKEIENAEYKNSDYKVVWLKDFETAHSYLKYCSADPWCYFETEDTFEDYENGGRTKLYLLLKPGFEELEPGDPGYGASMIGIDVDPGEETGVPAVLLHASNRYNHSSDPELDEKAHPAGDNRYSAAEISQMLGGPFWEICPPYTAEELKEKGFITVDEYKELLKRCIESGNPTDTARSEGYNYHYITMYNEYDQMIDVHVLGHETKYNTEFAVFDDDLNVLATRASMIKELTLGNNNILAVYNSDYESCKLYKLEDNKMVKVIDDVVSRVETDRDGGFITAMSYTSNNKYFIGSSLNVYESKGFLRLMKINKHIALLCNSYGNNGKIFDIDAMEPVFDGHTFYNFTSRPEFKLIEMTSDEQGKEVYLFDTNTCEFLEFDRTISYVDYNYAEMKMKLSDDQENQMLCGFTSDNQFREWIPWCNSIKFDQDRNCYIAELGGNRGYDIYDWRYRKILTQLTSLKKLDTMLRKKGYSW